MRISPVVSRCVLPLSCVALLLGLATAAAVTRGRDPWAFRLILENKTRMLAIALRSDLWMAYNPSNCGIYKVWKGNGTSGITFAGKVWDFSTNCSAIIGAPYHVQKDMILSVTSYSALPAPDAATPNNKWTSTGVTFGTSGFTFSGGTGATLTSPVLDFTGYDNPNLLFNESTAGGQLHVQISQDGGTTWTTQEFDSTPPSLSPQPNLKLIVASGNNVKIRWTQLPGNTNTTKVLTAISVFGDYHVWTAKKSGATVAVTADWKGYRTTNNAADPVTNTRDIFVKYDLVLPGPVRASVEEHPEALTGAGVTRTFTLTNLPASTVVSLKVSGPVSAFTESMAVTSGAATLRTVGSDKFLDFSANGSTTLNTTWQ